MSDDEKYLVWSIEHQAWWGPGRNGYVTDIDVAGIYSRGEAIDICRDALPGRPKPLFNEVPVPVAAMREVMG
jgi:hypothetical protein